MNSTQSKRLPASFLLLACCVLAALLALMPSAQAGKAKVRALSTPMPGGSATPKKFLPPGAPYPDKGPSSAVFPEQDLTIRFNHKKHIKGFGLTCESCHKEAKTSKSASTRMLPKPTYCDSCHGSDHKNLAKVKGDAEGMGSCGFCHVGYKKSDGNKVKRLILPTPNLRFNHKIHADRKIKCESCHGAVQKLELATREQLPRMKGCFNCHNRPGPQAGKAKSDCVTCHIKDPNGVLRTSFAGATLKPPRWMGNMLHTPDFLARHKQVAANRSSDCASCHTENFCTDCHDGRVRPRSVHPNDYISLHATEARLDNPRCTNCHQQQQFCVTCHQRAGVTKTGSPGNVSGQGRFHPSPAVWSGKVRTRQHHAWEAQRNINACVSCHTERDCAVCHATTATGGGGFNPHPASFLANCGRAAARNARACLVCHNPGDAALQRCR